MVDVIRKTLQQVSRYFPFRRGSPANDDGIESISSPMLGDVNYGCDGCAKGIKEGELRYNCNECADSFDLCASCYDSGLGQTHLEHFGHLHDFTCETRNNYAISRDVKGDTLEETIANMFKQYANRPAIGSYIASRQRYEYISFRELEQFVSCCVSALHHVMSQPDHTPMVSICSVVRLEWYIVDYACSLLGIPSVGIGASSDEEVTGFILNQTESSVVVCSSDCLSMFLSLVNKCTKLREIIVMDLKEGEDIESFPSQPPNGVRVWRLTEFLSKGTEYPVDYKTFKTDPDKLCTIAYTSGSTGMPKGCVFPRKLWIKHLLIQSNFNVLGLKRVWFSFQPPSHMMERESFHMTLLSGNKAGIYRGSMEHLFDDIQMVRPTVITSTPRFYSIIYNRYLQALSEEYKQYMIAQSNDDGAVSNEVSPSKLDLSKVPLVVKDKVKDKFKHYLGGREKMMGIGGAAVPPALVKFLSYCFAGIIQEGYGTTEVGSITSGDWSLGDVMIRLRDVPEMGYLTTDTPPRGEVCVKTSYMIPGYYKNSQDTEEKFQDGFFCTGDIGVMERPGYVRVIDRKKNIFKLAQGEFVAPERIEYVFEEYSSLIEQVFVYGNIWQTNVVALVVPHKEALLKWWNETKGEPTHYDVICNLPQVQELFMNEMRTLGEAHKLPGWEIPSAVLLEPNPFTQDNHLLTNTMKKSRPQLEKRYKDHLERLYQSEEEEETISVGKKSIEEEIMTHLLYVLKRKGIEFLTSKYNSSSSSQSLNITLTLTQLGGDSLTAMSLSNLLLEEISVTVSAVFILRQPLVSLFHFALSQLSPDQTFDMTDLITNTSQTSYGTSAATGNDINWDKETKIDFLRISASAARIDQSTGCTLPVEKDNNVVLLTGPGGFLGRFILWELLKSDNCNRIYCLCRSRNESESVKNRIENVIKDLYSELIHIQEGAPSYETMSSKCIVVPGDLSQSRLGLNDDDFTTISQEVNVVIHNGAAVNHVLLYNDLKPSNVQSTKEIIKLCCQTGGRCKYLHYVSTLGVFALGLGDVGKELTEPNRERLNCLSGYSQTKWVSEKLVMNAISDGFIKGNISRPGLIGAHSVTGHCNRTDWFYQLVCGVGHMKCYPIGPSWDTGGTPITAVDTVARAIVHLSLYRSPQSCGSVTSESILTYHLGNTNPQTFVKFTDVISALKKVTSDTELQPLDEHLFLERLSGEVRLAGARSEVVALHLMLSQGGKPMSRPIYNISSDETSRVLEPLGIDLNVPNEGYMDRYVSYMLSKQIF